MTNNLAAIARSSYCIAANNAPRAYESLMKQNRRRDMLTKGGCLLRDNARSHVARDIKAFLDQFGWDVTSYPPYSPDLAPSDYHLFLNVKEHLGGKRMETDEEVKKEVTQYPEKRWRQVSETPSTP